MSKKFVVYTFLFSVFVSACSTGVPNMSIEELLPQASNAWSENANVTNVAWNIQSEFINTKLQINGSGIMQLLDGQTYIESKSTQISGVVSNEPVEVELVFKARVTSETMSVYIDSLISKTQLLFLKDIPLKTWINVPNTLHKTNAIESVLRNPYMVINNAALTESNRKYEVTGAINQPLLLTGGTLGIKATVNPEGYTTAEVVLNQVIAEKNERLAIELQLKNQRREDEPIFNLPSN